MKITAVVPIQTHFDTIKHNFILLDSKPLFLYVFETLLENSLIDEVVCYSSFEFIKDLLPKRVRFVPRNKKLNEEYIRLKDILNSIRKDIQSDYYILCAITSPFISNASILKGIESIMSGEFDSAFSVLRLDSYAWFKNKALNFNPNAVLKTNEIEPIYIETKGFYIFSRKELLKQRYLGKKPKCIEVNKFEAINVKNEEDIEYIKALKNPYKKPNDRYYLLSKICSHIIFDMDGVLVNSLTLMQKAWEFSGGEKLASFDLYKRYIGIPFNQICFKLGIKQNKIAKIKEKYFDFSHNRIKELKLYDEVYDTIEKLKNSNIKLSIVTSKDYKNAKAILEHFKLKIDCLIAPDSPYYQGRNKPFGDPLLYACVQTHTMPKESIFIGDMQSDYQAAKNANIDFIFASYGYGEIYFDVNSIKNIKELLFLTDGGGGF